VTRDLGFSGLIRRTAPFSRLLRHTRECGGSILTWILTGIEIGPVASMTGQKGCLFLLDTGVSSGPCFVQILFVFLYVLYDGALFVIFKIISNCNDIGYRDVEYVLHVFHQCTKFSSYKVCARTSAFSFIQRSTLRRGGKLAHFQFKKTFILKQKQIVFPMYSIYCMLFPLQFLMTVFCFPQVLLGSLHAGSSSSQPYNLTCCHIILQQ
jgi:hypothetical protein